MFKNCLNESEQVYTSGCSILSLGLSSSEKDKLYKTENGLVH